MEIMAVFIMLFGSFSYALAAIVYGYLCNNQFKNPVTLTFFTAVISTLIMPIIFFWGLPTIPPSELIPVYLALGLIMVLVHIPAYKAYKETDTSIVNCMWMFGKVLVPIAAFFFLGEELHPSQYIGFFLIIFANFFLNFDAKAQTKLNLAFFLMLLAALFNTTCGIIEKYILIKDVNWINLIFYVNIFSTVVSCFFLINKNIRQDVKKQLPVFASCWKQFLGAKILGFIGHTCGIYALSQLPLVVKSGLSSTESLFVLLISFILIKIFKIKLKEKTDRKNTLKKIICFSIVIIGVVLSVQ